MALLNPCKCKAGGRKLPCCNQRHCHIWPMLVQGGRAQTTLPQPTVPLDLMPQFSFDNNCAATLSTIPFMAFGRGPTACADGSMAC
ncbi:hypothetical protein RSOLAG1IB_09748 [Rhizoctonia solani AG-1 IB]|uniref:Uncharacterized protein n=1 Tax=Thanatephorus cucumeris (strain AG1-IB / isolate 7/3/14) TaxID=1108050 RepID=A0A0B7FRK0_THACB|nr:hypothetical protein RSOLAG1IB_09748 [Rhizoctonia solani AG-1 IB]